MSQLDGVSVVIPAKNASSVVAEVLDAVLALREAGELDEIIVVDDGSTDDTREIAARYPVRCLESGGLGPGGARNVGWRASHHRFVWFMDSDCVAPLGTVKRLVEEMEDERVAGVGGGYSNLLPSSIVATLIHEEMELRAPSRNEDTSFLRGANMMFRREVLEELGGFDECHFNTAGSPGAEDMEIGYRALEAGHRLRFVPDSRVGHYHPTRFGRYLRSQRHHGYWRAFLYVRHRDWIGGDSYTDASDHIQPPLALAILASTPLAVLPGGLAVPLIGLLALLALNLPIAHRLVRATGDTRQWLFVPFGAIRAFWRAVGAVQGVFAVARWWLAGGRAETMDDLGVSRSLRSAD